LEGCYDQRILTAPYDVRDSDGWELNVMSIDGTVYLEEHLSVEKFRERYDLSPTHRLQTYYGYAFQSWCTTPTAPPPASADQLAYTNNPPDGWGGDVNTNVEWCSVVESELGGVKMIIGGEVDCVRGRYTGGTDTFVELKTSLVIRNAFDNVRFQKKLLRFYIQSLLLGVPQIVVGFRTKAGELVGVRTFETVDVPGFVRENVALAGRRGWGWDVGVCLRWGERFVMFLRQVVCGWDRKGKGLTVWRVTFTPKMGVSVRTLNEREVDEVRGGEDRVGFLPRSFWEA